MSLKTNSVENNGSKINRHFEESSSPVDAQARKTTSEIASKQFQCIQGDVKPNSKTSQEKTWYQRILSLISREDNISAAGDKSSVIAMGLSLSEELTELETSGVHTRSFVNKIFKNHYTGIRMLMAMPGLAIVAAYLQEKHQLKNLYVCNALEAFQEKLQEIKHLSEDGRYAFIMADNYQRCDDRFEKHDEYLLDASHKVAVCVEKRGQEIKVAVLDSVGVDRKYEREMSAYRLQSPARQASELMDEEIILWYVHQALKDKNSTIYYSTIRR